MNIPWSTSVAGLLEHATDVPRWAIACLPKSAELALDDPCLVIDGRDLEEHEDVSQAALDDGLTLGIGSRAVIAVLENSKSQREDATLVDILSALNYYLSNDAFIEFR